MDHFRIGIIERDEQQIHAIESLRKEVFHLKPSSPDRYRKMILEEIIIPFALYDEEKLIGGCYVGKVYDSLHIYFLFVKEKYQKTGLQLGRRLLQEVINHKGEVEELLDSSFTTSTLYPICEKVREVYQSIGYEDSPKGMMIKCI